MHASGWASVTYVLVRVSVQFAMAIMMTHRAITVITLENARIVKGRVHAPYAKVRDIIEY